MNQEYRDLSPNEPKQPGDEWLSCYGYWEPWVKGMKDKADRRWRRPIVREGK